MKPNLPFLSSLLVMNLSLFHFGTASADATGGKMPAAGIMYLCDDAEGPLTSQPSHFGCPAANGLMFRTAWGQMEPTEGNIDWSHLDGMIAAAQAAHRPMGMGVTAGFRSPTWVASAGAQMLTGSLIRSFAPTRTISMPLPWDPVYLSKWGDFLNAMGKRYDNNPNLAYVTMAGMGASFEPFMARAPEDVEKFKSVGGLHSWEDGAEKVIDLYAQAFPHTPFVMAMANPIKAPEAEEALSTVVDYGLAKYPGRFGVMYHGLDATASEFDYFGRTIKANTDKTTVGYQMVWSTTGINARWLKGSLENCLESGVRMKAHFIEVYGTDCDDPQYTAVLQRVGVELKAQAGAAPAAGH